MAPKKIFKKFVFKTVVLFVNLVTVFSMTAGPALASAPSVTAFSLTNNSISVSFDQGVLHAPDPNNIGGSSSPYVDDLRNYPLTVNGTNVPLSRMSPFNLSTNFTQGATSTIEISGLDLPVGGDYTLNIGGIGNLATSTETMAANAYTSTGTVAESSGPRLDTISPMYGSIASNSISVTFDGANFPTATSTTEIQCYWENSGQATATIAVASATSTVAVFDGTNMGSAGTKNCALRNTDTGLVSATRRFYLYDPNSSGILKGTIKDVDIYTAIDKVVVDAYQATAKWNRYEGLSQKDGKFAIPVPAGTYSIDLTTPGSGSTGVAPATTTGKVVTAGAATDAGTITFVSYDVTGHITAGGAPVYGAQVRAHNMTWTVEQTATTGYDGSYKMYLPPSSSSCLYGLDFSVGDYYKNVLGYVDGSGSVCVDTSASQVHDQGLPTPNVTGTVISPSAVNTVNPVSNHFVPNASVRISNSGGFERTTQTDSSGVFKFGGVNSGTFTLELNPPPCGSGPGAEYCMLTKTTNTITIASYDTLNTLSAADTTFRMPNFFGSVVDNHGAPVADISVNMGNQGFGANATTDAQGRFSFYLPNTGTYQLQIQAPPAGLGSFSAQVSVTDLASPQSYAITLTAPNISGYVYGPLGSADAAAGQANSWLNICPQYGGTCYGMSTDGNGAFSTNVADGTWTLSVQPSWNSVYIAPPSYTIIVYHSSIVAVNKNGINDSVADTTEPWTTNGVIVRLVDPANDPLGLIGTVYGPAGSANATTTQANIQVGIRPTVVDPQTGNCSSNETSRWTQTNSQGSFGYSGVADGTYEVEATPMNNSNYSRARVCPVTIDSGHRNITINLTTPNISGTVKTPLVSAGDSSSNPTPNQPVQYGWVSLQQENSQNGGGGWYGTNTNDSGGFAIGGVPAGTYTLQFQPAWGSAYSTASFQHIIFDAHGDCTLAGHGDGDSNSNACDLNTLTGVGDGAAVRVGIPSVIGSIYDPTGLTPVPNAWVMVHSMDWSQNAGSNSDGNGVFRIGSLADGTYQIEINTPGGGMGQQAYTTPNGLAVTISGGVGMITKDGNPLATNNKVLLSMPSKTISGTITKGGTGVAHARVSANRDMGGGFFETTTNDSGAYTLRVSGGGWWLQVMPDFTGGQPDWIYSDPPKKISFANNDTSETQTVNFTVTASDSTIIGLIKTPDGQAVQNVWVQVQGNKGMGSGGQTDNNGRFTIRIPAGTYFVNAMPNGGDYGAPDQKSVTVASGQTSDAGTLYLKTKSAHIKGFVQDDAGNPLANVVVNANVMNGPGWTMTYTDQTGAYDLGAWAGDWNVMVMPMSQSYIYQGAPQQITLTESETSNNNNFQLKAADKILKVSVKKESDNSLVTDVWGSVWIKDTSAHSMLDFGGPMTDMMEKSGMTAGGTGTSSQGMQQGGFAGGALNNGYTEINVPAGTYQVGLGMPPGSKYTLTGAQTVTIGAGATSADVTLLVSANDKTVSGHFYRDLDGDGVYDSGEAVAVSGNINADNGAGGWQMTQSNSDGSYSMQIASGDWFIHAFIDSAMAFGSSQYMVVNDNEKTTVGAGGATRNFQVKKLDATITGTVYNPGGSTAMTSGMVWVFADFGSKDMIDEFNGPGGPGLGAFTGADGTYELKVPAGTYKIGVGIPPWDTRDLLNPEPLTVTVAANGTASGKDLTFKLSDAMINGQVLLEDTPEAAYVKAWSDSGKASGAVSTNGNYTLKITKNDIWHVVAAAQIGSQYYESPETVVTTGSGTSYTQNLALASKNITIPDGVSSSFDSSQSKTIKLTNGAVDEVVMDIPAGALAASGTVTVSITPTVQTKPDSKDKPIGVAYDFEAHDADGNKIENFNQDVTITIAYDPALIAAAGYDENNITPKYYDTTTGSWENYSNVVRDTDNNKLIIKTDHFSTGGITGGDIPTAPSGLTAAAASSAAINLSWTDNSSNETGFKIYRNGSLVSTAAANATSYPDTGLTAGTSYSYYVKATNDAGDSLATASASATTSGATATANNTPPRSPGGGSMPAAQTTKQLGKTAAAMTQAEIIAQIAQIQALIGSLQAQLAALTGQASITGMPAGFKFSAKLKLGMKSLDVQYLQSFLKSQGTAIYPEGLVTGYYGAKTAAAVARFQEKFADEILKPFDLTQGTGILGEKTMQKINNLLGI